MELSPKERVGRGLDILAVGLRPYVDQHMSASVGGRDWVSLLQARDEMRDGKPRAYSIDDPQLVLRVLTQEWRAFGPDLTRPMQAFAEELRHTRNRWAHSVAMSEDDAARALDTTERLLSAVGAHEAAAAVDDLRAGMTNPERTPDAVPRHDVEPGPVLRPRHRTLLAAGHARVTIESGPLDVDLVFQDAVNYALVHNRISPLRSLTVSNLGDRRVRLASIVIALESPFEERFAEPLTLTDLTIEPGEVLEAPTAALAMQPRPGPFARMLEAVTGELTLVATTADGRYRADHPVRLLARDEWWAKSGIPESLAAFVSPRDPAVAELLAHASELLRERTGDPSLPGYQAGAERVLAMTEALYDAMRAREIRYVDPPASFEGTGQKIRPPREVLVERWGTCLDLTCAFAAALEAAGLNPAVVLCEGHAFPAVFVEEVQLEDVALREPNVLANLAESGLLVAVETTALTARQQQASFTEARAATRHWFTADLARVDHALDVRSAHRRVRPLPVVVEEGGAVVVVEAERAPEEPLRLPKPPTSEPARAPRVGERPARRPTPPRVDRWRNALLDLSFRNPLLNMRTGRSGVDLHVPAGSLGTLGTLEDMIVSGIGLTLLPHDRLDPVHVEAGARTAQDVDPQQLRAFLTQERRLFAACATGTYESRLRGLARRARTVVEETGANNLYVALGTLRWWDHNREAVAPLFLVPVTLKQRRGRPFEVRIEDGAFPVPNQCLLEKLRVSRGLEIPDFQEPDDDGSGFDLPGTLQEIRAALLRAGLPYRVEETAHLAIFQFATLQLWQDLTEHWESFLANPVVRHLVETPTDSYDDGVPEPPEDPAAEAAAFLPVPVDGSQLEAVRWSAAGRSFVLEGPPGTGKSQTITNLIAHNLAEGRRVLFVAEKQAALDVVKRRLDAVGLGTLSLDLHGRNQTPAAVRAQLREALHLQTAGNPEGWRALQATYRTLVAQLRQYPHAIHETGPAGLSAWTAREVVLTLSGGYDDARPPSDGLVVPREVVARGLDTDELFSRARDVAEAATHIPGRLTGQPWALAGPQDDAALDGGAVAERHAALTRADAAITDPGVRDLVDRALSPAHLDLLASWLDLARDGHAVPPREALEVVGDVGDVAGAARAWDERASTARAALARLRAENATVMETFRPDVLGADAERLLTEAHAADAGFFKRRPRRRVLEQLAPFLREEADVPPKALVAVLEQLVAAQRAARDLVDQLAGVPGVQFREPFNPFAEDAARRYMGILAGISTSAALAAALPDAVPAADRFLAAALPAGSGHAAAAPAASDGGPVRALAEAWRAWFALLGSRPEDVKRWRRDRPLAQALRDDARGWDVTASRRTLIELRRWVALQNHLAALVEAGLADFAEAVRAGGLDPFLLEDRLRLGIAWAALDERLAAHGLDGFDARARESIVARFVRTGEDVRGRLVAELPARIVAARSFDPNRMTGLAGELSRELSRQRGGLSIRQLMHRYGSVVGQLTPCLLMSPHSVARFLVPGAVHIDLVVFDEASQIRVAEAVGAMGRGRSVIVVGDSKQMPPTTFGGPGEDDGETDRGEDLPAGVAVTDRESILSEAVDSNLPRLALTWHYRSRDESLIAFSNRYYYDGRLATFPGPPGRRAGTGISWRRVDGVFERGAGRVNHVEAHAVVEEVRHRLNHDGTTSIGVVTFNVEQRDLILDLLEASDDARVLDALAAGEDGLFVKNLENVQGDERDVVLFSLAFSRDPRTGVLPLNFGPLNRVGGERRLNVAITRAKRQVVLFTSFEPEDIQLERTSSVGLTHLRDYLVLAARGMDRATTLKPAAVTDLHRDAVAESLREAGLVVRTGIGLSDFTVDLAVATEEGGPWVAVLLDGPGWAGRKTVGDRDALPTALLTGTMGWPRVEHVWLPSWLAEPDDAVTRIVRAAQDAEPREVEGTPDHSPPPPPPAPPGHARPRGHAGPPDHAGPPPAPARTRPAGAGEPFVAASTTGWEAERDRLDALADRRTAEEVRKVLLDVVAVESPVEAGRLARIVGKRFGFQRIMAKRADEILRLAPRGMRRSSPLGTFYWAEGTSPETYRAFRRTPEGVLRPLTEVAPEEITNALEHVARASHGISREELLRECADIFGARRLTAPIRERLGAVLELALSSGRLTEADGRLHAAADAPSSPSAKADR